MLLFHVQYRYYGFKKKKVIQDFHPKAGQTHSAEDQPAQNALRKKYFIITQVKKIGETFFPLYAVT